MPCDTLQPVGKVVLAIDLRVKIEIEGTARRSV